MITQDNCIQFTDYYGVTEQEMWTIAAITAMIIGVAIPLVSRIADWITDWFYNRRRVKPEPSPNDPRDRVEVGRDGVEPAGRQQRGGWTP